MNLSDSKKKLALAGAVCGIVAAALAYFGNPANMAFCIACFIRDYSRRAWGSIPRRTVQYARPEIIGLVLGAFLISAATKEYRSTAGSSPMARFVLGMILAIGSLVFLGCPLRMIIRMSAGDLNAWVALIGFVLGVGDRRICIKERVQSGQSASRRPHERRRTSGPAARSPDPFTGYHTVKGKPERTGKYACSGPAVAGRRPGLRRVCTEIKDVFCGSIRDVILMRNFDLLTIIGSFFVIMLVYNIASGNFVPAFDTPGRDRTFRASVNILGMYAVGFAAVLAGGCPLRQLILAGQDRRIRPFTVLGMLIGAALAHNLGLAASATAVNAETQEIVSGSVPLNGKIAVVICIAVCFIIGFGNKRTEGR